MNESTQPVVLFDGICNLCNKSVQFILRYEKNATLKFTPLQSDTARQILSSFQNEMITDSVLLIENNHLYQQSTAALLIAKKLKYFWVLYPLIYIPRKIRDSIYKYVAKNRYQWFGKRETCMIPDKDLTQRFL